LRSSRGRPLNAPAAFIHPCQPIVAKQPPSGPGWAHELKHDGYRLQIHVRDGRVRLYTINGNNWTDRYPRIVEEAIGSMAWPFLMRGGLCRKGRSAGFRGPA
jgi:ATP-dependent DNA ligase